MTFTVKKTADHQYLVSYKNQTNSNRDMVLLLDTNDPTFSSHELFWDFFNSGALRTSLSSNQIVAGVHSNLETVFNSFMQENASDEHFSIRNPNSSHVPSWVKRYKKMINGSLYDGWVLDLPLFIEIINKPEDFVICKNFTGNNSIDGSSIVSPKYHFANTLPHSVCSNSKVYLSPLTPQMCGFVSNHSQCPFYEPLEETILSKTVTLYGGQSIVFNLNASVTMSNCVKYTIIRLPDKEVNYTFSADKRTEQTDASAIEVLNEIVSSYDDPLTQTEESSSYSEKNQNNSFILSLA